MKIITQWDSHLSYTSVAMCIDAFYTVSINQWSCTVYFGHQTIQTTTIAPLFWTLKEFFHAYKCFHKIGNVIKVIKLLCQVRRQTIKLLSNKW